MAYDPKKAALFNQLRQQGLSEDAASTQAGITDADSGNYAIGDNGQLGAVIAGAGKVAGVDFVKPTAANIAESNRFTQGLQSSSNFEQVDYAQDAKSPPGKVTPVTYTTTSTETVSGGGSTTIIAGAGQPTPASQALQPAVDAKQVEINQFNKDNPSNFARKKLGLPPLTAEENQKRSEQALELSKQRAELTNQQQDAQAPGTPTVTTVPNTTTTTQTVTAGIASVNTPVTAPLGSDPTVNQQTETQLGIATGPGTSNSPVDPTDPSIAQPVVINRLTGRPIESPVPYGNLTPDQQANRDARLAEEEASRVQNLDTNYWANKRQPSLVSDTGISVVLPGGSLQFADPAQYEAWSTDPGAFAVVNIGGVDTVQPYPQQPTSSSVTTVDPTTLEGFGIQAAVDPTTLEGFAVQAPVDPTTLEGYGIQAAVDPTTLEGFGVPGPAPLDVNQGGEGFGNIYPDGFGGFVNGDGQAVDDNGLLVPTGNNVTQSADPVNPIDTGYTSDAEQIAQGNLLQSANDAVADEAAQVEVGRQLAQQQAVNAAQKKSVNNGDWRVRLSLAPGARYLYNAPDPGILDPLTATDGVIFPYTPSIDMAYKADYDQYALTHSNYKGYFYKSSSTEAVQMKATFTAQDSAEANYLLAVIHFFRSVTKMFYGQDPQRGAPPPLVYLSGLGQYQFAVHPCVISSFSYQLPDSVDYIRARSTNINGTNLLTRRVRQDLPTNPISGAVGRLANLFSGQGISYGAEICRPPPPTLGQNQPTYVPTKMDINLTLLPVQSRRQVSQQFSLRGYANGDLLKRGFW